MDWRATERSRVTHGSAHWAGRRYHVAAVHHSPRARHLGVEGVGRGNRDQPWSWHAGLAYERPCSAQVARHANHVGMGHGTPRVEHYDYV